MNSSNLHWLWLSAALIFACSSCKKEEIEDPIIPNEDEIITTLHLTMTPTGGGTPVVMTFLDLDADGPLEPTTTVSGNLTANSQYTASLLLLNETESPADTVNVELLDEAEEHQFFFVMDGPDMDISYVDADADGNPLGLINLANTGAASEGALTVILRHEPDKFATGVADGDISNAGGETDIETSFDIIIE